MSGGSATGASALPASASAPASSAVIVCESQRLLIRHATGSDAMGVIAHSILHHSEVVQYFPASWQSITTAEAGQKWWVERQTEDVGPTLLVERKSDKRVIGFFGVLPIECEWLSAAQHKAAAQPLRRSIEQLTAAAAPAVAAVSSGAEQKASAASATLASASPSAPASAAAPTISVTPAQTTSTSAAAATATTTTTTTAPALALDYSKVEIGYMFARDTWGQGTSHRHCHRHRQLSSLSLPPSLAIT
jgi:hypothetical protein